MTRTMMILLGLAGFGLAGCNTVEGMGEDVEDVGEAVSDTANEAEAEIDPDVEVVE